MVRTILIYGSGLRMKLGKNIEKNEAIKILRPGSYWQEFTVILLIDIHKIVLF
jgi:hypothetical protein